MVPNFQQHKPCKNLAPLITLLILLSACVSAQSGIRIPVNRRIHQQSGARHYAPLIDRKYEEGFLNNFTMNAKISKDLTDQSQVTYTGLIGFGKNSATGQIQNLPVVFDTGSSWLWAATPECASSSFPQDKRFDSANIPSYRDLGAQVTLNYGKGEAVGQLSAVNAYFSDTVMSPGQVFVAVSQAQAFPVGLENSGIFGLSRAVGSSGHKTIIENLYDDKVIPELIFTVSLTSDVSPPPSSSSSMEASAGEQLSYITLGEADTTYTSEPFYYQNLLTSSPYNYYYTVEVTKIKLGDMEVTYYNGIADTGTTQLILPTKYYNQVVEELNPILGNEGCDYSKMPTLYVQLGTHEFSISPQEYFPNDCQTGAMIGDLGGENLIIMGDLFLRKVVVAFDLQNERIGFAGREQPAAVVAMPPHGHHDDSWKKGVIIASAIVGSIVLLGLVYWCWKRQKKSSLNAVNQQRAPLLTGQGRVVGSNQPVGIEQGQNVQPGYNQYYQAPMNNGQFNGNQNGQNGPNYRDSWNNRQ